jgi:seryl-tRNA synthetase
MVYTREKIEAMKIAKGYKVGEPALVAFEVLIELIESKEQALDEVQELIEENKKLRNQLKTERIANADKERDYLKELKKLENQIEKANVAASTFLAAEVHRKFKAKKVAMKLEKKKIFSKTDLLLGAYNE